MHKEEVTRNSSWLLFGAPIAIHLAGFRTRQPTQTEEYTHMWCTGSKLVRALYIFVATTALASLRTAVCARQTVSTSATLERMQAIEPYLDSLEQQSRQGRAATSRSHYVVVYGVPSDPRTPWLDPSVRTG